MHRQRKIVLGPKCYSFGPKLHVSGEERSDEQIGTSIGNSEADAIRSVQRERSAALLAANIEAARRIHSDEFQLITPLGAVLSKDQYLSAVETGVLKYSVFVSLSLEGE
jgi:hypothetical protein